MARRADIERPEPYRRRQFVASHRRRRLLVRLLKPFLAAFCLVGAPAVVAAWVWSSPTFALQQIDVSGARRVNPEWARQALSSQIGRHLLAVRLADIEGCLADNSWISGAEMRTELPNRLFVRLIEYEPSALLRRDGGLLYVDAEGTIIDAYSASLGGADLLQLSLQGDVVAGVTTALDLARELGRLRPQWAHRLSEIEVLSAPDFRVHVAELPFPIAVSSDSLASAIDSLEKALPEIRRRYPVVASVDLRFSGEIIIQPAVMPPSEGS